MGIPDLLRIRNSLTTVQSCSTMRPRLCFVGSMLGKHTGYPPDYGETLAKLFTQAGYSVRLVSSSPYRLLRLADIIGSLIAWRNQTDLFLINVYSGKAFGLTDAASLTARWLKKPVVLMLHGGNLPNFSRHHPRWVQRVFSRAAAITAPSRYLAECVPLPQTARVIPNVIPVENYPFRLRRRLQPRLMWMRTFEATYHPLMAVETLRLLLKSFPDAHLTLAGRDQGLLEQVQKQIAKDHLEQHIFLVGYLNNREKLQAFSQHDLFLNTNRIDNMPISLIEAAASGLPIIATNVGGIPFLVQHEATALLVENGDAYGMTEAVKRLLTEPELAERLSQNGRRLAERFTWKQVQAQWEELFAQLLQ